MSEVAQAFKYRRRPLWVTFPNVRICIGEKNDCFNLWLRMRRDLIEIVHANPNIIEDE